MSIQWPARHYVALAVMQAVVLGFVVGLALWPPVEASPVALDRLLVPVALLLVAYSLWVAPRLPSWGVDISAVATWLLSNSQDLWIGVLRDLLVTS